MAGYTRQSTYTDGDVINASDSNDEFDQLVSAFGNSTGHTHDGTAGEGARITVVGTAANNVTFGTALTPDATNTIDIGTSSVQFKDLYLDGTANIDSLVADTADINGGTIDGATIGGTTAAAADFTTVNSSGAMIATGGFQGTLTGAVIGNVTGDVTGNADTATALETSRNFSITGDITASDVSFDGSGNVALSASIDAGVVDTAELAANAVTTAKITDANVTTDKLATDAVTTIKITDANVTNAKLENSSVTINSNSLSLGGTLTLDTDDIAQGTSNLYYNDELVDDRVNALLTAGSNISLSYNDAANTLTISSTQVEDDLSNNDTDDLAEGSVNLYFTNTRADGRITNAVSNNTVQGYDAGLNSIAGLTTAANKLIYTTASDTYATSDLTSFGRSLIDDADASAARTTLGVDIGSDVQAYDAGLASIAGLTTAADKLIYTTASDTYATADLSSYGRSLIDDADASAARTTLGLGTIATQAANSVNIDGGAIDSTPIGATTASTGNFSTLSIAGAAVATQSFATDEATALAIALG